MVKVTLKYVHNDMKTPYFHFTLDFRRLIARRRSLFLHLYIILLLNLDTIQIRTDLWSDSPLFYWLNSDPIQQ